MTAQNRPPAEPTAGALTAADVLNGAATLINHRGWHQGDWTTTGTIDDTTCPICVLAALNIAAGRYHAATITGIVLDAAELLASHLGLAHLLQDAVDVHEAFIEVLGTGWNDDGGRTEQQVVDALRATAAKAVAA